jgi:DtxR family Mn-dependent transcriptional regulator
MVTNKKLSSSLEDYLEAIFHVVAQKQVARSRDIAERLGVNRSSVTGALQSLADKGLVNYEPYEAITLTKRGEGLAKDVVRRHEALRDFLVKVLSVDTPKADEAACQMEHAVPQPILERLIEFVEFVEVCPRGGAKWVKGGGYHCTSRGLESCRRCISSCLEEVDRKISVAAGGAAALVTLKELRPGQKGKVTQIRGRGEVYKRLLDMGVTPGSLVEMRRVAPLGDPLEIKVRGYHLSLRKQEAEKILVELLRVRA